MNVSEQQTSQMLDRVADGSDSAVRELFEAHRSRLRRSISLRLDQRLKSRVDASDVVQNVMVEAIARLPSYLETRPIPFYAWLRRLAWDNLSRLHEQHVVAKKRSVTREVRTALSISSDSMLHLAERLSTSTPSQQLLRLEMRNRVQQALLELSDDDRELLIMKHLEDLTLAEIAATLEISIPAVKGRHLRALQRLNQQLSNMGDVP